MKKNKKILWGSIVSVAILFSLPWVPAVGLHGEKSTTMNTISPLFGIRTKRAVGKENLMFDSHYLGEGREPTVPLPKLSSIDKRVRELLERLEENPQLLNAALKMIYKKGHYFVTPYQLKNLIANGVYIDTSQPIACILLILFGACTLLIPICLLLLSVLEGPAACRITEEEGVYCQISVAHPDSCPTRKETTCPGQITCGPFCQIGS